MISMRTHAIILLAVVLHAIWSSAPFAKIGAVNVRFENVDQFTDASLDGATSSDLATNVALKEISEHLVDLGARCLKTEQILKIGIRDVDLAGTLEWWHRRSAFDLRVMRSIDFPRIDLDFVWVGEYGRIIGQGTESVADMSYLRRGTLIRTDNQMIPYEKVMLTEWFERRFCPAGTRVRK